MVESVQAVGRRLARRMRRTVVRPVRRVRGQPPIVSRSWPSSPPDFVGVGAQRCGTSWWYSLIESHPDVHTLAWATKELHYFDTYWQRSFEDEDVARYHQLFRRPSGRLAGEWTPRYMFDPWTPLLLHRAAPDARLLVMLRDPMTRFTSALTHCAERGRRRDESAVADAVGRGYYHPQLTRILAHFAREQVLVLQFEQCRDDTEVMLRRTLRFLGLADTALPSGLHQPVNRSGIPGRALPRALLDEVRAGYRTDVERLARSFPEIDLRLWPNFADLA